MKNPAAQRGRIAVGVGNEDIVARDFAFRKIDFITECKYRLEVIEFHPTLVDRQRTFQNRRVDNTLDRYHALCRTADIRHETFRERFERFEIRLIENRFQVQRIRFEFRAVGAHETENPPRILVKLGIDL
ncbi:hypothetical protein D3C87_1706800 [compost metagenome]